jgi:ABC-type lipoprotein release transport system permease subunit
LAERESHWQAISARGVFVAVGAFLAIIAMAACIAPAVRASRIDPNALLRD